MTPVPSLIFTCVASLAMLLVSDVFVLINYYSQILWLSVAASIGGMLWLRYKQPDMPRPIKTNIIIPLLFLAACAFLVLFPIPTQPVNTVIWVSITLSGIPVYYLCIHNKSKPKKYYRGVQKITEALQTLMEVTFPEEINQKLSDI
ncbi:hypothetical protein ILUMI_14530 [Ignelater luminosus]|uniref:Uncharacterized protein n=1 Tax=Ignelater luminosus TaxID=2038154 RepID=A0A8K0GAU6_IGNLU|nr:hypothetical protein ILUMI_14530 [Ignelater luminosus]